MKDAWKLRRNVKGLAYIVELDVTRDKILVVEPEGPGTLSLLVKTVAGLQESFGHSLVIIPEFVAVPLAFAQGTREVLHLTVRKRKGHRDAG